jgi:hypothetical protein
MNTALPIEYQAVGLPTGVTAEYFPNGGTAQVKLTAATSAATGVGR